MSVNVSRVINADLIKIREKIEAIEKDYEGLITNPSDDVEWWELKYRELELVAEHYLKGWDYALYLRKEFCTCHSSKQWINRENENRNNINS